MKRMKEWINKIYFTNEVMTEADYEKGRNTFIIEGSVSTTIGNLSVGAFLTGFAKFLGASESFCGLLLTIPIFTSMIQLFSPIFFEKLHYRKFIVATLAPLHRLMLGLMIFIPFLFKDTVTRLGVLFVFYTLSHLIVQITNSAAINWIMSLVPETYRGRYYGKRDSFMLAVSTCFTLSMGVVLDFYKHGNLQTGFIILYTVIGILAIANFFLLGSIKEPKVDIRYYKDAHTGERIPAGANLKQILIVPFLDVKFRKVVWISIIYNIAIMVALPYFAIYQVSYLKLSYTFITIGTMAQTITMIFFARIWGRLADAKNWFFTARVAFLLLAAGHITWFFVNKDIAIYIIPFLYVMGGICWSGINMSMFNIPYRFSPNKAKTVYLSFNSTLAGIISLIVSLISSRFIAFVGERTIPFWGMRFTGMQITFLISGIFLIFLGLFVWIKFEKNPIFND